MVMVAGAKELSKEPNGAGYHLSWKQTMADDCYKVEIVEVQWRTSLMHTCFLRHKFGSWQCRLHPLPEQSFFQMRHVGLSFPSQMRHRLVFSEESWDDAVSGKTVFVKFFAPWSPGRSRRVMVESPETWKYIVMKPSFSTITLDIYTSMLLMMHVFTRENRCGHCKKMKPVTRRRYDFGSPRVSLRVIKFQKRTSVSPSGMQMIFITRIRNHEYWIGQCLS